MMRFARHIIEQPFVFATGLAALAHSTWSLATLFSGKEPEQFTIAWLAWLAPALLIAFSLDVGQIVTSAEIRAGQRSRAKYATFAVFAVATYYLQWLYIAHHMPQLQLAPGVRETWADLASVIRDAAVWFIPALLPLSTLLYTFSHNESHVAPPASEPLQPAAPPIAESAPAIALPPAQTRQEALPANVSSHAMVAVQVESPPAIAEVARHIAQCECGWSKPCDTERSATNSLNAHRRHCNLVRANGHKVSE